MILSLTESDEALSEHLYIPASVSIGLVKTKLTPLVIMVCDLVRPPPSFFPS